MMIILYLKFQILNFKFEVWNDHHALEVGLTALHPYDILNLKFFIYKKKIIFFIYVFLKLK